MSTERASPAGLPDGWRLQTGIALLALSFALPIIATPVVALAELEPSTKAMLTGALWVGIPEVMTLVAILLLGKRGFDFLISIVTARLKSLLLVRAPGPIRHTVGLAMFIVPLLLSILAPYLDAYFPGWLPQSTYVALIGHVVFLLSFFILGGEFWDKVRALFQRSDSPPPSPDEGSRQAPEPQP
jgi:hypothetical protein